MTGQGNAGRLMGGMGRLLNCAALAAAVCLIGSSAAAATAPTERVTPSGMAVPRYVSTKFDKVNARAGPGDDHRLLFVYKVRGLPLQVVAETIEWRRVCDPSGNLAWVHKRTTDGRRTAINTQTRAVALLKKPKTGWKAAAYLNPRALATLDRCEKGWCRVKAGGVSGWTPEGELWGTRDAQQCH